MTGLPTRQKALELKAADATVPQLLYDDLEVGSWVVCVLSGGTAAAAGDQGGGGDQCGRSGGAFVSRLQRCLQLQ